MKKTKNTLRTRDSTLGLDLFDVACVKRRCMSLKRSDLDKHQTKRKAWLCLYLLLRGWRKSHVRRRLFPSEMSQARSQQLISKSRWAARRMVDSCTCDYHRWRNRNEEAAGCVERQDVAAEQEEWAQEKHYRAVTAKRNARKQAIENFMANFIFVRNAGEQVLYVAESRTSTPRYEVEAYDWIVVPRTWRAWVESGERHILTTKAYPGNYPPTDFGTFEPLAPSPD